METSTVCNYREEWLTRAIPDLESMIVNAGAPALKAVRVTVSWPASGHKGKAIGECYHPSVSADGSSQITINPKLNDPVEVLGVLLHELIHASVGIDCGHKGAFKRTAKRVGLAGKMKATTPGPELTLRLKGMLTQLGAFPHSPMSMGVRQKVQTTRLLKIECPSCGYTCRTTSKWIEAGYPTCPCGEEMQDA